MFEVHQVKVHIFGIAKCLQYKQNVGTDEVDITVIITFHHHHHVQEGLGLIPVPCKSSK